MKFTAEDAFELQGTDDAIILTISDAKAICMEHSVSIGEFMDDTGKRDNIDAGDLFDWLGY